MSKLDSMSGEEFPHKISAEYETQSAAERAVQVLQDEAGLPLSQIRVVRPHDPDMSIKIEPETKGIAKTLVKWHVALGVGALMTGLIVAGLLVTFGPAVTRSSPVMTFIALGFLFPALGLLLAGLISLRPDHDPLIARTRTATALEHWTVIVHCATSNEKTAAKRAIGYSMQTL